MIGSDPVEEVHKSFRNNQRYPLMQSLGEIRGDGHQHYLFSGNTSSNVFHETQLRELYDKSIMEGFLECIRRMGKIWPEIAHSSTAVYAPVLEWDTYRIEVDKHMRTPIPNVYAVGDGAGLSQGVVTAASSGLIAAGHLSQIFSNSLPHPQSREVIKV
jgi:uncharacterized FAD-dependent dehydrogenase